MQMPRCPQIRTFTPYSVTARYTRTNGSTSIESIDAMTVAGLIAAGGILSTGANAAANIFQSVRVKSLRLWGFSEGSGSIGTNYPPSISVRWYNNLPSGSSLSSAQLYNDVSLSTAFPAFLQCKPPQDLSRLFVNIQSSSQTVFEVLLGPYTSAVLDVTLELLISDQSYGPLTYTTTNTMSPGNLYYYSLDNGNKWVRVGLPFIV